MSYKRCPDCGHPLNTKPRYETKPTKGAKTWQAPVLAVAERLGTPFIPWQRKAVRLLTELDPQGLPRFDTVIYSTPRQSGKTVLFKSTMAAKAESEEGLNLYGTSDTGHKAALHLKDFGRLLKMRGEAALRASRGDEEIIWPNGSTYRAVAPNETAGHSFSIDMFYGDEAWTVTPEVLGGVLPAMTARPHSQLILVSTMGTADSEEWNNQVAKGRASITDPNSTIAYLEYSAPSPEAVFDESRWHEWMPALGWFQTHRKIRAAMEALESEQGRAEVVRAYGNLTVESAVALVPSEWLEAAWRPIQPPEVCVLALDVNRDPDGASIAQGFMTEDGEAVASRMEWRYGPTRWLPETLRKQIKTTKVETVVVDWGRPWPTELKAEIEDICERSHIPLVNRVPKDMARDNQSFYDGLKIDPDAGKAGTIYLDKQPELVAAIEGATRKNQGKVWFIIPGKRGLDISPLIATVLATGMARELDIRPVVKGIAMAF